MRDVYIVAAKRTPIGKFGGVLKDMHPANLGAHAMRAALTQAGLSGDALDVYIMGNILRAGHGQLLPRQAAIKAGIPSDVDGYAIDMVCSSGMQAVMNAATLIKAGEAEVVLAGGMESMSQAGFALSGRARWGYKYLAGKPETLIDTVEIDGLTDPLNQEIMGSETDRLSDEYNVTRQEADEVAYQSHMRAAKATEDGTFAVEIAPIEVKQRKAAVIVDRDEGIRTDTSLATLAGLRPAFNDNGILTAGNSSQLNDGAAALILASEDAVAKHGLTPLAKYVSGAWAGVASWRFVEAPIPAVRKLLAKTGHDINAVDLFENNEAFATNSVLFNKVLEVPYDKLNIYGSGISLGHPIGATGARLFVTLINGLKQTGGKIGVASLCHGSGGGTAVLIENVTG
jgi:acetyl-CoA C-acetyltransferase